MTMARKWAAYFRDEQKRDDDAALKQSAEAGQGFLTHCSEYERRLKALIAEHRPRPDSHEGMLYQVGVRDGLELAQSLIDGIRAQVVESRHD